MITAAESRPNMRIRISCQLTAQIHSYLTGQGDVFRTLLAHKLVVVYAVKLADCIGDFINSDILFLFFFRNQVFQRFLRQLKGNVCSFNRGSQ